MLMRRAARVEDQRHTRPKQRAAVIFFQMTL